MNDIRSQIFGGEKPERRSLIGSKRPRGAKPDALQSIVIAREEKRTQDSRDADRHRLVDETVALSHGGRKLDAELINLSGGGAMVRADFAPMLWPPAICTVANVNLERVRWVRDYPSGSNLRTNAHRLLADRAQCVLNRPRPHFPTRDRTARRAAPNGDDPDGRKRPEDRSPPPLICLSSSTTPLQHALASAQPFDTGAQIDCESRSPPAAALFLDLGHYLHFRQVASLVTRRG